MDQVQLAASETSQRRATTAEVTSFMPAFSIPFLAWSATAAELVLAANTNMSREIRRPSFLLTNF